MLTANLTPSTSFPAIASVEKTLFEIQDENFSIQYLPNMHTVTFQGELQHLGMAAYAPVIALLDRVIHQAPSMLCLDLRNLTFLNSSGICMLLQFVLKVRNQRNIQLVVKSSSQVSWHRSLHSLQKVMPDLDLQSVP